MVCNHVLQYIDGYFKVVGYQLFGTFVSLFIAIILYGLITIPIINYGFGIDIVLKMIMCHLLMSVIMTILIMSLYYLLKEDDSSHDKNKKFIKDTNDSKRKIDKSIDEVIKVTTKESKKRKVNKKKSSNKNTNSKKNVKK